MEPGPGGSILRAIDLADDLIHNARPVPFTGQVRIRRSELDGAVSHVRDAALADGIEADSEFAPALERLDLIASDAAAIPLTDEVRCDREEIYDALDTLRAQIPQWLKQARWDWKEAGGADPPSTDEITLGLDLSDERGRDHTMGA